MCGGAVTGIEGKEKEARHTALGKISAECEVKFALKQNKLNPRGKSTAMQQMETLVQQQWAHISC